MESLSMGRFSENSIFNANESKAKPMQHSPSAFSQSELQHPPAVN